MKIDSVEESKASTIMSDVIELATQIAKDIEGKLEPIDKLERINQLLHNHHEALWQQILSVESKQVKREFYHKVFKAVSEKMLNERVLQK